MYRRVAVLALSAAAAFAGSGCSSHSPSTLADRTTRAIYATDREAAVADFDTPLQDQVTRAQVGALSDLMHRYGAYKGLRQLRGNDDAGRYDFQAAFDKGTMVVQVRMDPSGKIGAYRVSPAQ